MSEESRHPKWWLLYLMIGLLGGLFAIEVCTQLSDAVHRALEIGIIMIGYGLVNLWFRSNTQALRHEDQNYLKLDSRVVLKTLQARALRR